MGAIAAIGLERGLARDLQSGPAGRHAGPGRSENPPAPERVMFNRILFSSIAAAALLGAAPAFAAETPKQPCSCCSDGSVHEVDHALRQGQNQKAAPAERAAQDPSKSDDPNVRNQSFGG